MLDKSVGRSPARQPAAFPRSDDLDRIRILRDSVLDLSLAIDELDAELTPRLADRARLDALLREAQAELATLLRGSR